MYIILFWKLLFCVIPLTPPILWLLKQIVFVVFSSLDFTSLRCSAIWYAFVLLIAAFVDFMIRCFFCINIKLCIPIFTCMFYAQQKIKLIEIESVRVRSVLNIYWIECHNTALSCCYQIKRIAGAAESERKSKSGEYKSANVYNKI